MASMLECIKTMFAFNKDKSKQDKRNKEEGSKRTEKVIRSEDKKPSVFAPRTAKELVAPNGVNPNPLGYMELDDGGKTLYIRSFYIDKLPRRSSFAETFKELFNFSNSTVSVFVDPLVEGRAIKELDKEIINLDSERLIAIDNKDRNRERKVAKKMGEAEEWSTAIDSGENTLFEVGFLFTIFAETLEELDIKSGDLHSKGRSKGIELSATYACHPEAFLSNTPINKPSKSVIKYHQMDKFSLSTIFNHTRSEFSHKFGATLGRNMNTGKPVIFDIYDKSHNGYGVVITGTTNAGKSTTVKVLVLRYEPFGYRFVSLDTQARGNRGEYSMLADQLNGVNYQIHSKSKNIINLFELDTQKEFDEITQTEYETLDLATKITDIKHILMTMIRKGGTVTDYALMTFIERIVTDIIKELYHEKGIIDGEINSLYKEGSKVINGKITSGLVKKELPTVTDFFVKALRKKKANTNPSYIVPLDAILATMEDYVRELYICTDCLKVFTREEVEKMESNQCSHCEKGYVREIKGIYPYYDGQSTIQIGYYTPYANIDISQLHEKDKPIAQQIALNFINENFIKKNSVNAANAEKLVVIFDETHKMFPFEDARKFIVDVYRTARKYHVSPWTATQRLADYTLYEECMAIITNATAKLLLRHDAMDKKILLENTILTESQADLVTSLDKGEIALIDNSTVVFVKIDLLDIERRVTETDMANIKEMYTSQAVPDVQQGA